MSLTLFGISNGRFHDKYG